MNAKISQAKQDATSIIKQAKRLKKIPDLATRLGWGVSWFYKVADDVLAPSYERAIQVIAAKSVLNECDRCTRNN